MIEKRLHLALYSHARMNSLEIDRSFKTQCAITSKGSNEETKVKCALIEWDQCQDCKIYVFPISGKLENISFSSNL